MAKTRQAKEQIREEFGEKFKGAVSIIAEYKGMSAEDLYQLRTELKQVNCDFKVLNNRVAKKAIEEYLPEASFLLDTMNGQIGVTFVNEDPAAGAKALLNYAKDNKDIFKVRSGVMEAKEIKLSDIKALSELPSKDVLLAKILSCLVSPHRG